METMERQTKPLVLYELEPIGQGADELKAVQITSDIGINSIYLGRNELCGLDAGNPSMNSKYLSRKHLELAITPSLRVRVNKSMNKAGVSINNQLISEDIILNEKWINVKSGDKISLLRNLNQQLYFTYRIIDKQAPSKPEQTDSNPLLSTPIELDLTMGEGDEDEDEKTEELPDQIRREKRKRAENSPLHSKKNNALTLEDESSDTHSNPNPSTIRVISKDILDQRNELECCICCSDFACAHALNPCGCTFCYECLTDWTKKTNNKKCPRCNQTFRDSIFMAVANNIVKSFLKANFPEELPDWEGRNERGMTKKRHDETTGTIPAPPVVYPDSRSMSVIGRSTPSTSSTSSSSSSSASSSSSLTTSSIGFVRPTPTVSLLPRPGVVSNKTTGSNNSTLHRGAKRSLSVCYASNSRRECSHCKSKILINTVKVVVDTSQPPLPGVTHIYHLDCLSSAKIHGISQDSILGFLTLKREDQLKLLSLI